MLEDLGEASQLAGRVRDPYERMVALHRVARAKQLLGDESFTKEADAARTSARAPEDPAQQVHNLLALAELELKAKLS